MSEKQVLQELWDIVWNVPFNAPMVNARKMKRVYKIVGTAIGKKLVIHKTYEQIEKEGKKKKKKKYKVIKNG